MKIRLRVPVIYDDRLYQQGTVLEVSPLEGGRMVHDKVAVPEPEAPKRQVIRPPSCAAMAEILALSLVKSHIHSEREDEDDYLQHLVEAAISRFITFTGRTLRPPDTNPETLDWDEVPLYTDICHGLLLLIGQWYEYRENAMENNLSEMPEATRRLWQPYVIYHLGDT